MSNVDGTILCGSIKDIHKLYCEGIPTTGNPLLFYPLDLVMLIFASFMVKISQNFPPVLF